MIDSREAIIYDIIQYTSEVVYALNYHFLFYTFFREKHTVRDRDREREREILLF